MKKLAVLVAVVSLAALAAPAFSATNPFMDVPMNHWAYDAIGELAARGIISGYPDGMFSGQKAATRYELASTIARSLAVVDMTKASKQDVEVMKRLVVEFRDELEALGVRVDELDERVAVFEDRLGGWKLSGTLALEAIYDKKEYEDADFGPSGSVGYDDMKLVVGRRWGENDEYNFTARFNGDGNMRFDRFFVDMPFFFDSRFTLGRFAQDWEEAYRSGFNMDSVNTGGYGVLDQIMTNWAIDAFEVTKNFALGQGQILVAHPSNAFTYNYNAWMVAARGTFQFTEQFGFDLGLSYYKGDNAEDSVINAEGDREPAQDPYAFDNMMVGYAGLRYNFNDNIALKGVYYMEKFAIKEGDWDTGRWNDYDSEHDSPKHFAAIVDVAQPALKYSSLWLEYGQYDQGFVTRSGTTMSAKVTGDTAADDIKYYRAALGQEWNDKWATHIFYYGYDFDQMNIKPKELGLGVRYTLNDSTTMGLNFMNVNYDQDGVDKDNIIRFRTTVNF